MISSIELKSIDFDDENFSPVFSRKQQEYFFTLSDRAHKDYAEVNSFKDMSLEDYISKYALIKPNHTYYRQLTIEKFFFSGILTYLALRELPLRNFYARSVIMFAFFCKWYDFTNSAIPYFGKGVRIYIQNDEFSRLAFKF